MVYGNCGTLPKPDPLFRVNKSPAGILELDTISSEVASVLPLSDLDADGFCNNDWNKCRLLSDRCLLLHRVSGGVKLDV